MMPKIKKPPMPAPPVSAADLKTFKPFDPTASAYKALTTTGPTGLIRKASTVKPSLLGE